MSTPLLILYATVTGNAEYCANKIADAARTHGYEPRVWNLDGYDVSLLDETPAALFCVSTYGEGDPPDDAVPFWEDLQRLPFEKLSKLRYAVYALGDTSYDEFCGFGKKLDAELAAKGARCIAERSDNDLEYDAGLDAWCTAVFAALPAALETAS